MQVAGALLLRAGFFALLWWALAERDPWREWPLAAATIVAATGASFGCWPLPRRRVRVGALLRFGAWFLGQSLRGGIDVARRALHPRMPLRPGFVELALPRSDPTLLVLLTWIVSLLPGTAVVRAENDRLTIHVLDERLHTVESLRAVERHLARWWGRS